jgi:hypothetical protein
VIRIAQFRALWVGNQVGTDAGVKVVKGHEHSPVARLLRVGRERPSRRAAEKRDDLAPPHVALPKSVWTTPCGSKHSTSGHGSMGFVGRYQIAPPAPAPPHQSYPCNARQIVASTQDVRSPAPIISVCICSIAMTSMAAFSLI